MIAIGAKGKRKSSEAVKSPRICWVSNLVIKFCKISLYGCLVLLLVVEDALTRVSRSLRRERTLDFSLQQAASQSNLRIIACRLLGPKFIAN